MGRESNMDDEAILAYIQQLEAEGKRATVSLVTEYCRASRNRVQKILSEHAKGRTLALFNTPYDVSDELVNSFKLWISPIIGAEKKKIEDQYKEDLSSALARESDALASVDEAKRQAAEAQKAKETATEELQRYAAEAAAAKQKEAEVSEQSAENLKKAIQADLTIREMAASADQLQATINDLRRQLSLTELQVATAQEAAKNERASRERAEERAATAEARTREDSRLLAEAQSAEAAAKTQVSSLQMRIEELKSEIVDLRAEVKSAQEAIIQANAAAAQEKARASAAMAQKEDKQAKKKKIES